jgi:hypothetical protein
MAVNGTIFCWKLVFWLDTSVVDFCAHFFDAVWKVIHCLEYEVNVVNLSDVLCWGLGGKKIGITNDDLFEEVIAAFEICEQIFHVFHFKVVVVSDEVLGWGAKAEAA